ncbi:MAG: hypothetical protein ACJ74S_00450 [Gaiellaceae bacterium]
MTGLLLCPARGRAPQLNILTLACADIERMASFLLALGWAEARGSERVHRVFQLSNGSAVDADGNLTWA